MAIVVDATIGGTSSNSYVTVARSNVLADTLPHMDGWLSEPTINKPRLLVHATRLIDRHFLPHGSKVSDSQALWWPQANLRYANTTAAIPTTIIPEFVELATIEWAWALHQNPYAETDIAEGLEVLDTPSYRMEFSGAKKRQVPQVVADILAPYVRRQPRSFTRLVRM